VNISEGGMAVNTSVPLGAGEDVQLHFILPDNKMPWLAQSRICWRKAGRLGIRFVSLSEEQKSELECWLSKKQQAILPESVTRTFQEEESSLITALADKKQD
jgi:hypothetical protein